MGMHIRDERQMKALTGLSQAQFNRLLPVFNDIYHRRLKNSEPHTVGPPE